MKRIFIAINLPQEIKSQLQEIEKELEKLFPSELSREMVRWVKKDNLHITLLFVGQVDEIKIPQIYQIVQNISQNEFPFSLKLEKVTYGPPGRIPPRLIWVELEKKPQLVSLAEKLKNQIMKAGILKRVEQREFSPHITLGRIRTWQWKKIEPEERPEVEKEIDLQFEVKSIEVMESKLKRTGAEYTILQSFYFKQ